MTEPLDTALMTARLAIKLPRRRGPSYTRNLLAVSVGSQTGSRCGTSTNSPETILSYLTTPPETELLHLNFATSRAFYWIGTTYDEHGNSNVTLSHISPESIIEGLRSTPNMPPASQSISKKPSKVPKAGSRSGSTRDRRKM